MILVVEDEPGMRLVLKTALEKAGYRVVTATDGSEALTLLRNGLCPTAVLTDFMMPHLDGNEFLEALGSLTTAPILIYSGYVNSIREELRHRFAAIYQKPMAVEKLVSNLHTLLQVKK